LEISGADGKLILSWFFRKWDRGRGLDWSEWGWGQVVGFCECGNEPSGSIKFGEFLDKRRISYLQRKDSAQWS
jgi:hypothetical protein